MSYPRYSFQHSILYIDQPERYVAMVASGLLNFPVHFEFCSNDINEALARMKSGTHDLIISALDLQGGSVLDFIGKIKEKLAQIPAIYISEPHLLDVQKKLLKTGGVFDILQRAKLPDELFQKMDQAVRVTCAFKRTRAEAFIELHEASIKKGVPVVELLDPDDDSLH